MNSDLEEVEEEAPQWKQPSPVSDTENPSFYLMSIYINQHIHEPSHFFKTFFFLYKTYLTDQVWLSLTLSMLSSVSV